MDSNVVVAQKKREHPWPAPDRFHLLKLSANIATSGLRLSRIGRPRLHALLQQTKQSSEHVGRRRRTSFNVQIDGNDILDTACHSIAVGKNSPIHRAGADSYHPLWIGCSVVSAQQRVAHVLG